MQFHIAIIGGGITGLSAAWYLQQQAQQTGLTLPYTLLEQSQRWGGKVLTEQLDGVGKQPFVVEAGPDAFLTQKPWALQLAHELGLADRLLATNDAARPIYVLHKGRPVALPDGMQLVVPTRFMPFALSPLISPMGKLRMALDLVVPAKPDDEDEALADFVRRRFGQEAADKIAEPLMAGIYSADIERQSLLATFPRLRDMERQYGSLIRGMRAALAKQKRGAAQIAAFMSFQNGTQELVQALVAQLTGHLQLGVKVKQITRHSDSGYTLILDDNQVLHAQAVLITTPAYVTAQLIQPLAPQASQYLTAIRYVSTGTISLAFRQSDIQRPLSGFGLIIPASERRPINAITVASTKFDGRAPDDCVLLRVFFGGARTPQTMQLNDNELVRVVCQELKTIFGIQAQPLFHRIYRWYNANPQYDINHLDQVAQIEAMLPPGIYVAGSAYRGVGLPDCVHQAEQMVQRMIAQLICVNSVGAHRYAQT